MARGVLDLLDELERELVNAGSGDADERERKARLLNGRALVAEMKRRLERWGWRGR